jgi:hypothetical protein
MTKYKKDIISEEELLKYKDIGGDLFNKNYPTHLIKNNYIILPIWKDDKPIDKYKVFIVGTERYNNLLIENKGKIPKYITEE